MNNRLPFMGGTLLGVLALIFSLQAVAQRTPGFTFTTSEALNVMHFMHTATGGEHSSPSYRAFIDSNTINDDAFSTLLGRYGALSFDAGYRRPGLPRRRYRARSVMDFLWLHSAASGSLQEFSSRSVGLLSVADHAELFDVLAKAQPYYQRLVAIPQRSNIERTERFLDAYEGRVAQLFWRVSKFYGTPWPADIPFTVALAPIPLATGTTSAVPKVNTLVCSYLSENDEDYKATLGVAVHEMCHSIYDEQPADLQQKIDDWFSLSRNKAAPYAYAYFNEGLATAIGNGWAYEQLNGEVDEANWYADPFIDGFAHALYPLVKSYLAESQAIDRPFIEAAIEAFAKTFPDADRELAVLLNSVGIYADTEDDATLSAYSDEMFGRYRVSSSFLRAPLDSPGAIRSFGYPQLTKVILVDRNRERRWTELANHFDELTGIEMPVGTNASYAFYNASSKSPVVVFLIEDAAGLGHLLDGYKRDKYLQFGEAVSISVASGD